MITRSPAPLVGSPAEQAYGFDSACRIVQPSLCYITVEADVDPSILATGCLLTETIALTSLATVSSPLSMPGKLCLRARGRRFSFNVVFADDDRDLALVRLGSWGKQSVEQKVTRFPVISRRIPDLGLLVGMLSYSPTIDHPVRRDSLAAMFHSGYVSWWMGSPLARVAVTMGPVDIAARGGPAFLATGELVGIVSQHPDVERQHEGIVASKAIKLPMMSPLFEVQDEIDRVLRTYG